MIRRLASLSSLAVATALAACTPGSFDAASFDTSMFERTENRFLDRHPIAFRAPQPVSLPVHGVDVAKWQGDIDWPRLRSAGVRFAFIKATEGGDHVDSRFLENWRGAHAAGIPTGAYHFYFHCRGGAEQARWFIRHVPKQRGSLPPVLDMEWNGHSKTCPGKKPRATVLHEMREFLRIVTRHYGQKPIIYSTVDFHREILEGEFRDYEFWLRSTKDHVDDVYPTRDWLFWQYTATGRVPGVEADIDLNAFKGGERAWTKWVRQRVS